MSDANKSIAPDGAGEAAKPADAAPPPLPPMPPPGPPPPSAPPGPPPAAGEHRAVSKRAATNGDSGARLPSPKRKKPEPFRELCVAAPEAVAALEDAMKFCADVEAKAASAPAQSGAQEASLGPRSRRGSHFARTVEAYEILRQVGLGTYGEVYKARDRSTGEIVALKKILVHNEREGYPLTALREMRIMQSLSHVNILQLKEIVPASTERSSSDLGCEYMVMEYLDNDLTGILENRRLSLSDAHVKCYMKQLLEGLYYIHTNKIAHRDMKAANILVSNDSKVKIGDWGLSRSLKPNNKHTTKVVTLWYRAPELLLGIQHYTTAIDVWAVGCIFAELLNCGPILPGKDEMEQLKLTFELCGTPTEESWPGVTQTQYFKNFKIDKQEGKLDERFAKLDPLQLDLLKKCLVLDPRKRITAKLALDHDYFWTGNLSCAPQDLPPIVGDGLHEFELKERRKKEKQEREERLARQGYPRGRGGRPRYHNTKPAHPPRGSASTSSGGPGSGRKRSNSGSSYHRSRNRQRRDDHHRQGQRHQGQQQQHPDRDHGNSRRRQPHQPHQQRQQQQPPPPPPPPPPPTL